MKLGTYGPNSSYTFQISDEELFQHLYVIGRTGTGKTTLLRNLIAQDLAAGACVVLIEPHGDLSRDVVLDIPHGRDDDLIYYQPAHLPVSIGLNLLHGVHKDQRANVAGFLVSTFVTIFGDHAVGDRSQQLLRNSLIALLEREGETLLSVIRLLRDEAYQRSVIESIQDPLAKSYWQTEFQLYTDDFRRQITAPILNKLDAFFSYPAIRNSLAQPTSIDLQRVIAEKQILIINLSDLAEGSNYLLGALCVSALWSAARKVRAPFRLYIDEFQHFTTHSISEILSEARKFNLSLALAHQFWGQVPDEVKHAVFGNVGTLVSFGIGALDAPLLAKQFALTERALQDIPNYKAFIRPLPPANARHIETLPPPAPIRKSPDPLIANSLTHFGKPRHFAEEQVQRHFPN